MAPDRIVVVERDPDATYKYAKAALQGPNGLPDDNAERCARAIAECDRPFLFARLAIYELLAAPDKARPEALTTLLEAGHGGTVTVSLDQIQANDPRSGALVQALAYSSGRGFPRTDGIWQTAGTALYGEPLSDRDISEALKEAAAYITIDFEHGRSGFRLAHRTFPGYFEDLAHQATEHPSKS